MDLAGFKAVARAFGFRRRHFVQARLRYERALIPALARRRAATLGRVLCYHSVGTEEWGANDVPPPLFKSQLDLALSLGYRFVPAETIASGRGGVRDLAITFDDGLMSVHKNAAAILERLDIPWSLFVVCEWAGGKHERPNLFMGWEEIRQAAVAGVAIGSHSMTHPDFGRLSNAEARSELEDSRRVIQERVGIAADMFAIPFGESQNWRSDLSALASSLGYRTIYAQAVDTRTAGTVPRTFITRFDDERVFKAALEGAFDAWKEPL
ncbi:MAG TPA: polysaccharide deacetylase family protein [Candidatus Dormibacteraeota bacterium]